MNILYYNGSAKGDTTALIRMIEQTIRDRITHGSIGLQGYDLMQGALQWEMRGFGLPGEKGNQFEDFIDHPMEGMGEVPLDKPNVIGYMDQLISSLNGKIAPGWAGGLAGDQGKNILYGVGAIALLGLLFPTFGKRAQDIFTRTALEGMDLLNKARSIIARTKEDIEDLLAEASQEGLAKRP